VLIINADDWGRTVEETDATLVCLDLKRVTTVSAMVFMQDTRRAAEIARNRALDAGLHLNLCEKYLQTELPDYVRLTQARVVGFLSLSKYALLLYHPFLRDSFRFSYQIQTSEFNRLYGQPPCFINGHKHNHLSTNMLIDGIMPLGQRVRRTFSFQPGEKGVLNRAYRVWINKWIKKRYVTTDHMFSLRYCLLKDKMREVADLARTSKVELVVHPGNPTEFEYLTGDQFPKDFAGTPLGEFSQV
jgi:predicted glycoside hydrolase/deacetylase ChbG (UPF0249 family)